VFILFWKGFFFGEMYGLGGVLVYLLFMLLKLLLFFVCVPESVGEVL